MQSAAAVLARKGTSIATKRSLRPFLPSHFTYSSTSFSRPTRSFSTTEDKNNGSTSATTNNINYEGIDSFTRSQMEKRHVGILMAKNSISQYVLPGDQMVKTNQKTGTKKMVAIERSAGYFWYLKDLSDTKSKPIVANDELISVSDAQVFPPLNGLNNGSLKTLTGEEESLPHFFTKDNRSSDPSAMCTLVGVAFNDYGNKMLPSWMEPFEHAFRKDRNRVKTVWLSINEGRTLSLLKYFITGSSKKNVPEERKDRTLLYFGDCPDFRDVLRMHNNKTGYVFLLDGLGRVRFGGSGKATDEELKKLIGFGKALAPGLKAAAGTIEENGNNDSAQLKTRKKKFNR